MEKMVSESINYLEKLAKSDVFCDWLASRKFNRFGIYSITEEEYNRILEAHELENITAIIDTMAYTIKDIADERRIKSLSKANEK